MGCLKLCGNFHITLEAGQGSRRIVLYCSGPLSVNTPSKVITFALLTLYDKITVLIQ